MQCSISKILPYLKFSPLSSSRSLCIFHRQELRDCVFRDQKKNFRYVPEIQRENRRLISALKNFAVVGAVSRLRRKLSDLKADKIKSRIAAVLVYEKCADGIDLKEFTDYFQLPDTFQSWFLAVQLHVWMCCLVTISEKNGRMFRNFIVDSMWSDVEHRLGELSNEIPKSSERKKYIAQMTDQFQAALISYDEGILSDDTVLAASVWRTFFAFQYVDPRLLESAVLYIRKQIAHLDSLNTEELMKKGSITFLPLISIVQPISDEKIV